MCSKTDLETMSDLELVGVLRVWRIVARERFGWFRTMRLLLAAMKR